MARDVVARKSVQKLKKTVKIVFQMLLVILAIFLTIYFFPQIIALGDEGVRENVREYVQEAGVFGVLLMFGIQLVQVILSIIPGEPVEVLFGFIYGPWLGALLCLIGLLLGSFCVFCVVRALGNNFMSKTENNEKYRSLGFLKEPRKRDTLIFLLFFLPGTPKDTLTYFAPFTKIELWKFLLISTLGRIPSVITSTFAGESIFSGDYIGSVIIFAVTGVVGIFGILVYHHVLKKHDSQNQK